MSTITPTIGRKVWLYTAAQSPQDSKQAFDATVIFVHPSGLVNLYFVNHWGTAGSLSSVQLRDPQEDDKHGVETYATWMPYQVGQAKKSEVSA